MKPPRKPHHGTLPSLPGWLPPAISATTRSATVPTKNEIVAAANVPTSRPRRELIGGCIATSIPANAESSSATPRATRASLRCQPVVADADVDGQRRIELVGARHLALDDLRRLLDLRLGRLEQQLVVDLEHERGRQPGILER